MTGCDAYGELLGGYVLHALEPDEAAEVARHIAVCHACSREYERLADLPALLDRVEPADVPPPLPPPALEEAILDSWARERRQNRVTGRNRDIEPAGGARAPESAAAPRPPARRGARGFALPWWRPAAGIAALAAAAGIALAIALPGTDDTYAHGTLRPVAGNAHGSFTVENVSAGTRVYLKATRLSGGRAYEVWCIRGDGRWVSGGTFRPRANGRADATLTAAVEPGEYHEVVITARGDEGRHGPELMRGKLIY